MFFCYGCAVAVDPVYLTSGTATSLTIGWNRAFYDGNKTAELYEIIYQQSDCSSTNSTSFNGDNTTITVSELNATLLNSTRLQYNLTGLKKWTDYIVLVYAFFPNGSMLGEASTLKCQTTLQDGKPLRTLCLSRIVLFFRK